MGNDRTTAALFNGNVYKLGAGSGTFTPLDKKYNKTPAKDILAGMKYMVILSVLLWWLPLVGGMFAGYLGGRRAGTGAKGLASGILVATSIMAVLFCLKEGLLAPGTDVLALKQTIVSGASSIPIAAPYLDWSLSGVGNLLIGSTGIFAGIMAFGYVGGLMAEQNRRDLVEVTKEIFADFGGFSGGSFSFDKMADSITERVVASLYMLGQRSKELASVARPLSLPGPENAMKSRHGRSFDRFVPVNAPPQQVYEEHQMQAQEVVAVDGIPFVGSENGYEDYPDDYPLELVDLDEDSVIEGLKKSKSQAKKGKKAASRTKKNTNQARKKHVPPGFEAAANAKPARASPAGRGASKKKNTSMSSLVERSTGPRPVAQSPEENFLRL